MLVAQFSITQLQHPVLSELALEVILLCKTLNLLWKGTDLSLLKKTQKVYHRL